MKHFLPLLIFTGLLFGQDGLILKSDEVYNGTFIRNVDGLIVFQVEGKNHFTPFPILDVETIVTKSGEFTYPFDIPTKQEEDVSRILGYRPKSKIGQAIYGRFVLGMGVSGFMPTASFGAEYNISRKTQIKMGAWAGVLLNTGEYPVFPFVTLNRRF